MNSELLQKEKILQLVLDNIPSFVFWKDLNSSYLGCNKNFAISAGLNSPDDIIGKSDYDLPWTKEDSDFYRKIDKAVMDSQEAQINFEESQTLENGDIKWLKTSKIPLYNNDKEVIGILGTYEDITAKKSMEMELVLRNKSLQKVNLKLEKVNLDLEQFGHAASHDLQEPLRMIGGFTGLLEKKYLDILDDEGKEYIKYIKEGANRMSSMIQQIYLYSKLNKVEEELERTNVEELITNLAKSLTPFFNDKNVSLKINLPSKKIKCQPERIYLLFKNLIMNGIKFNNSKSPMIAINFEERDTEWYFTLSDNGIGVDEKYQKYIFKPFKRLNNRGDFPGDGIGLSLCKRIIDIHKGQIWYTNNEEIGTTFHFTMSKFNLKNPSDN